MRTILLSAKIILVTIVLSTFSACETESDNILNNTQWKYSNDDGCTTTSNIDFKSNSSFKFSYKLYCGTGNETYHEIDDNYTLKNETITFNCSQEETPFTFNGTLHNDTITIDMSQLGENYPNTNFNYTKVAE